MKELQMGFKPLVSGAIPTRTNMRNAFKTTKWVHAEEVFKDNVLGVEYTMSPEKKRKK